MARYMGVRQQGFTLIELLVALVMVAILAALAVPSFSSQKQRQKEIELHQVLRDTRSALDRFHDDWRNGLLLPGAKGVSANGYPETLTVLFSGVDSSKGDGSRRVYLRAVPKDPLASAELPPEQHWRYRGYNDAPDASRWNGVDIFDLHPDHDDKASDGSAYSSW